MWRPAVNFKREMISRTFMKYILPTLLFSVITGLLQAQAPVEKLETLAGTNPIEKIYLHCDRDNYVAGETIWFKGYLLSEFLPDTKSTVLFAELVDPNGKILSRATLPIAAGICYGQIQLGDSIPGGTYLLRAYTPTTLNYSPDFIFKRAIPIAGLPAKQSIPATDTSFSLRFFAEGGNFLTNTPATFAFKASGPDGLPKQIAGSIYNSKGEEITHFDTYHSGMGSFNLPASDPDQFYAEIDGDSTHRRYYLPAMQEDGVGFRVVQLNDGLHFEILQQPGNDAFRAAYMVGQMQHQIIFLQPFKQGVDKLGGIIKTDNLSSGILHITVFNQQDMPIAERLVFVNNGEYKLTADIQTDTLGLSPFSRNHFTLAMKDTVVGSFSVAVTDPAFNTDEWRANTIVSHFLLSADLPGYIHEPSWYFRTTEDSARYGLDLVMRTNGWTRFNWKNLLAAATPEKKYSDPGFITLTGQIKIEDSKKFFSNRDLLLFIKAADSTNNLTILHTNDEGRYRADSLVFYGKAQLYFGDIHGRKGKFIQVHPDADSLHRAYSLPLLPANDPLFSFSSRLESTSLAQKLHSQYEATIKSNGVVLSEVVLRTRKKSALELLDEKYASGLFSGDSRQVFDLVNTDAAAPYTNIFDFLRSRVPGLTVQQSGDGDYFVGYRQFGKMESVDLFLDEAVTDATSVSMLPVSQIAMIKVYNNFVGSVGGGANGAIAIYLKKGSDYLNSVDSPGDIVYSNGFSAAREFYAPLPGEKANDPAARPNNRMTVYWNPAIGVAGVDPRVPVVFYNNAQATSFKIVVEGMTLDGKLLLVEKTISAKGF